MGMNMHDIAKETGYSIATVSRAINNSGYVSPKTKEKIMKVIEEKGYSVNAFAKGMATSSMSLVGILCSDSRDLYQANCIYNLQKELRESGYTALLVCTGLHHNDKQEAMRLLLSRNVDAVFLIGSHYIEARGKDNMYLREAAARVPVILINGLLEAPNVYSLLCDDRKGAEDLTQLVLEKGSRKPIFLGRRMTYSARQKVTGFLDACKAAGLEPESEHSVIIVDPEDDLHGDLKASLDRIKGFDALVCADDELALAALKYCQQRGLIVPEEVQITGYNNSSLSDLPATEITSYDNRIEYLCSSSVRCMKEVLAKKDYPAQSVHTGQLAAKKTTRH